MSYDPNLSKYLMIMIQICLNILWFLGMSFKMDVMPVDFQQEIVWPEATKDWPHCIWCGAEFEAFSHLSDFGDVPAGCGNVY